MRKLVGYTQYTCSEYAGGEVEVVRAAMHLPTRRMAPEVVLSMVNGYEPRFTSDELVLAAVAGRVGEAIYREYQLP